MFHRKLEVYALPVYKIDIIWLKFNLYVYLYEACPL